MCWIIQGVLKTSVPLRLDLIDFLLLDYLDSFVEVHPGSKFFNASSYIRHWQNFTDIAAKQHTNGNNFYSIKIRSTIATRAED